MPAQALSLLGLARPSSSPSSSILPTLPRSVRWLLVLIALLNYRALPGVWHREYFCLLCPWARLAQNTLLPVNANGV